MSEPMISLQEITKTYPGQSQPAVRQLDMDVPEGEIVRQLCTAAPPPTGSPKFRNWNHDAPAVVLTPVPGVVPVVAARLST